MVEEYPTLSIAGLNPSISESDLVNVLREMKMETQVVISRDNILNSSYRNVKIVFRYKEDAECFYATVNNSMFLGSKVYLTFTENGMNYSTTSGAKPLVIKRIPLGCTSIELYGSFRKFGPIIACKVMIDRSGTDCYSLLQYENQDHADQCFLEMNASSYRGSVIYLSWQFMKNAPYIYPSSKPCMNSAPLSWNHRRNNHSPSGNWTYQSHPDPPKSRPSTPPSIWTPNNTMMSLHTSTSNPPRTTSALNPQATAFNWQGQSSNFAEEATEQNPEVATYHIPASQLVVGGFYRNVCDMPIEPSHISPDLPKLDERNLFVKNLDSQIDDSKLYSMFNVYGNITSAKVMVGSDMKSKGFGFVSFESAEQATTALALNGTRCEGKKPLVVCIAEPKKVREKKLDMIHGAPKHL